MDVICPSLPPKITVADKVRPEEHTTVYMAAQGCHFVECSMYVRLVNIEMFSLTRKFISFTQPTLYKVGPLVLSSVFSKRYCSIRMLLRIYRKREPHLIISAGHPDFAGISPWPIYLLRPWCSRTQAPKFLPVWGPSVALAATSSITHDG